MFIKSFIVLMLGLTQSFFNRSQLKSPAMIIFCFHHPFSDEIFQNILEIQYLKLVGGTRLKLRLVCPFQNSAEVKLFAFLDFFNVFNFNLQCLHFNFNFQKLFNKDWPA